MLSHTERKNDWQLAEEAGEPPSKKVLPVCETRRGTPTLYYGDVHQSLDLRDVEGVTRGCVAVSTYLDRAGPIDLGVIELRAGEGCGIMLDAWPDRSCF